jgi:chemotaxis protein MotB
MAGKGGGAWKVAYADFVTAMMAFFLVMWITSQDEEVKVAIAGYFEDPWGTSSEHSAASFNVPSETPGGVPSAVTRQRSKMRPTDAPYTNGREDGDKTSRWVQQDKIHFLRDGDRTLPALLVHFEEASAKLSDAAKKQLSSFAPAVVGKLNKLEIRAHSTQRPLPSDSAFADHWQLCYERGRATMNFLEQHDVEPERMRLSQSAAYEPLTTRFETNWQSDNNCVEVFLLGEVVESAPGTEQPSRVGPKQPASPSAEAGH